MIIRETREQHAAFQREVTPLLREYPQPELAKAAASAPGRVETLPL